ncbi:MAG: SpoVA/SpoVAEb family sporulation membrane protein, partial [Clostridiales bacterium]|nr:SpoVA/SpoVAEb family sporulation membrane protein [Clostridiales bacterium]
MNIGNKEYKKYVEAHAQKSPCVKNCVHAFLSGGAICCAAQGLTQLYKSSGVTESLATSITSVTLIFITALLTGLGVFDNIAKWAGAGTLVPITG